MSNTNIKMGYSRWNNAQSGKAEFSLTRLRKYLQIYFKNTVIRLQTLKANKTENPDGSPQKF